MRKSDQMGEMVLHTAVIGVAQMIRASAQKAALCCVCLSRSLGIRVADGTRGI
jgi:hypothetical protein